MKLTKLRPDHRAPGHLIVEVDGARRASLPIERVRALGLTENIELSDAQLEKLEDAERGEKAYRHGLRLLKARSRAAFDLSQRLRAKGHDKRAAAEALGRLEAAGLVDDARFAKEYASVRAERGHGPTRILSDLLHQGIERRLAERAIADAVPTDEDTLMEEALALARKRSRQLGKLPKLTKKRRLLGYLARRGFGGGVAYEVAERVLGETD